MKRLWLLALLALPFTASAQAVRASGVDTARVLAETITPTELQRHLVQLASTDFEGRETGTDGQRKAAAYLAELETLYPGFKEQLVGKPFFMDWPNEPWTKASYSFPAPGQVTSQGPILRDGLQARATGLLSVAAMSMGRRKCNAGASSHRGFRRSLPCIVSSILH